MEQYIKKYGTNSLIISSLLVILSIFLIFKPALSISILMILFGVIITINGLVHVISYFQCPKEYKTFSFELLQGILGILIGLLFIKNPQWVTAFLPIIVGLWILIESIIRFQLAFNMRGIPESHWGVMLVLSIITAIFAIFIIFHPFVSAAILITFCGVCLLVTELLHSIESIYIMIRLK